MAPDYGDLSPDLAPLVICTGIFLVRCGLHILAIQHLLEQVSNRACLTWHDVSVDIIRNGYLVYNYVQ